MPLAVWSFQGQFQVNVPAVLASVVLSTVPILVLYALGRRQLVSGLSEGFSKYGLTPTARSSPVRSARSATIVSTGWAGAPEQGRREASGRRAGRARGPAGRWC